VALYDVEVAGLCSCSMVMVLVLCLGEVEEEASSRRCEVEARSMTE
jgi:hypothetical protein